MTLAQARKQYGHGTGRAKGRLLRMSMLAPSQSDDDNDIFDEFEL